jgi:hypothetical protein
LDFSRSCTARLTKILRALVSAMTSSIRLGSLP